MNNQLQIFKNDDFGNVRGLEINGQSWLVGKDITGILGYSNSSKALKDHVDEDDKLNNKSLSSLGQRGGWLINESGLYSLILRSDMPNAKKFKRWVTSEVLPQIRKTGGYIPVNEEMSEAEIMAKALLISQKTIEKKDELLKAKTKELEEKNRFINQIAVSQNSLKVEEVAQLASKDGIKIGRNKLWAKLREWGLIKQNSKYDPKQKYIDNGYFEVVEGAKETYKGVFTYKTTKVTGKGQVYIIERLLKECA
ncbi:phage antirepressor Ant [Clostridium perfringens]|nr:phage antirepressor Ant [Clostridium perfringens]